jgi:anti-sigma B factor antagonist
MQELEGNVPEESPGASNSLEFALEPVSQGVRVRIMGELDLATAPELDRLLDGLADDRHDRVLLDLSDVKFMDSTGLASIVRAHRSADANGHRVALRRGSPQVQRLFEITGMLDRLAFED